MLVAERRMFAKTIVLSDAFLDMPLGARCLYMTMGMLADDDGFVNAPRSIMRQCGASDDDMKVLISKKFVIPFESGVIVIKHWRINNYLQRDRLIPTKYQEELSMLSIEENGAYKSCIHDEAVPCIHEEALPCIQDSVYTDKSSIEKSSIDKSSVDKDSIEKSLTVSNETVCCTDVQQVIDAWNSLGLQRITKIVDGTNRGQWLRKRLHEYGLDEVLRAIEKVRNSKFLMGDNKKGWQITFDWFIRPNNFPKVLDGNYDDKSPALETSNPFLKLIAEGKV